MVQVARVWFPVRWCLYHDYNGLGGLKFHLFYFKPLHLFYSFSYSHFRISIVIWDYCNCQFLKKLRSFNCFFKSRIVFIANILCHISFWFLFLLDILDASWVTLKRKHLLLTLHVEKPNALFTLATEQTLRIPYCVTLKRIYLPLFWWQMQNQSKHNL